jgi:hypothetical protein
MLERFLLKDKNSVLGVVQYETESKKFSFIRNKDIPLKLFPIGLYRYGVKEDYELTSEDVERFFQSRVLPKERDNISYFLKSIGLRYYDLWSVLKKTRAMTYDDYTWLSKDKETFEEVHIRYKLETYNIIDDEISATLYLNKSRSFA